MKTKYAIIHKVTGKYFHDRKAGISTYLDMPHEDSVFNSATEAILQIIMLGGEGHLTTKPI